ncbi:MAG TPA: bifunctional phosphoribosylaminoimidazolecarboxamide formyltransferase/IMP cyclohydrolase, partial [Dehalococcoidia bacterium]|nr:bifunctional phosphoribosylaminoimidazolecarboxamide formyltransferase/IMP cyclohydrolase [Dehalococcoidia bacterium]
MIAFISVSDRTGVQEFALGLAELGFDIYATSGTQKHLAAVGLTVHNIESLTGFPPILGGRIKSIHPILYGGVLARRDSEEHMDDLRRSDIAPIDLVCVNLYPFRETVAAGAGLDECLEQIDIGGPAIIRAAAKNFPFVLVLVDPDDYAQALDGLRMENVSPEFRRRLAAKAFQHTAAYDTAIATYLRGDEPGFPPQLTIALQKALDLRYGENPHQRAALYRDDSAG